MILPLDVRIVPDHIIRSEGSPGRVVGYFAQLRRRGVVSRHAAIPRTFFFPREGGRTRAGVHVGGLEAYVGVDEASGRLGEGAEVGGDKGGELCIAPEWIRHEQEDVRWVVRWHPLHLSSDVRMLTREF